MPKSSKSRDPMPVISRTIMRSHIWLLFALGQRPTEIHQNLERAYTRDCPCFHTVCNWYNNFKTGHLSFEDEPHTGRISNETYEYYGDHIEQRVKEDPFVTLNVLAHEAKTTKSDVYNVIHNKLHYSLH